MEFVRDNAKNLPMNEESELLSQMEFIEDLRSKKMLSDVIQELERGMIDILSQNYIRICMNADHTMSLNTFKENFANWTHLPTKIEIFTDNELKEEEVQDWKKFLQNPDLKWFIESCAPNIITLKLAIMSLPIESPEELALMESFTKLENFICNHLYCIISDCMVITPKPFYNLKKFYIWKVKNDSIDSETRIKRFYVMANSILAKAQSIEKFCDPLFFKRDTIIKREIFNTQRDFILQLIENRMKNQILIKLNLNSLLEVAAAARSNTKESMFEYQLAEMKEMLTPTLHVAEKVGLPLENVNLENFPFQMVDEIRSQIKSLITSCPNNLLCYDYPKLEWVHVGLNRYVGRVPALLDDTTERSWPMLCGITACPSYFEAKLTEECTQIFIDHFFRGSQIKTIKCLGLDFIMRPDLSNLMTPKDIYGKLPYLTYINLQSFHWNNDFFLALWKHLSFLEHIAIFNCDNLGNDGFIGNDQAKPVICELKHLRYLELGISTNNKEITDDLLKFAIRQLPLKGLRITSVSCGRKDYRYFNSSHEKRFRNWQRIKRYIEPHDAKVDCITLEGLQTLKTGILAGNIERLDFSHLWLKDAQPDEVIKLQEELCSIFLNAPNEIFEQNCYNCHAY